MLLLVEDFAEVCREFIPPTGVSGAYLLDALLNQIVSRVGLQHRRLSRKEESTYSLATLRISVLVALLVVLHGRVGCDESGQLLEG